MRSSTWQPFLPPAPEASPPLCRSVNVEGTGNVLSAARKAGRDPVVVLVSSASVVGPTQDREPPVRVGDPVAPNDEYVRCKVEAEAEIRGSGLRACVLRLVAVMPTIPSFPMRQVVAGFDLPLGARCKAVTDVDAATACVAAAESLLSEVAQHPAGSHERSENSGLTRGSVFFVGGGKKGGWQIRVRDMCKAVFEPAGLSLPGEHLFLRTRIDLPRTGPTRTRHRGSFTIKIIHSATADRSFRGNTSGFAPWSA
jgi:nucleoside-diphosphate-sugar epimerase